jgi:hypothetical protein
MVMCQRHSSGEPRPPVTKCGETGRSRGVLEASVMRLRRSILVLKAAPLLSAGRGVSTKAEPILSV